jgi:hypothetical protein
MDAEDRTVLGEWHLTWNQEETWAFVQRLVQHYTQRGVRYLLIFWDHAPWHVAATLQQRLTAYNRQAKKEGKVRVAVFFLPKRSPWLMPLEAVFGQAKRAVGLGQRETVADLERAVDQRLDWRNGQARSRSERGHRTNSPFTT